MKKRMIHGFTFWAMTVLITVTLMVPVDVFAGRPGGSSGGGSSMNGGRSISSPSSGSSGISFGRTPASTRSEMPGVKMGSSSAGKSELPGAKMGSGTATKTELPGVKMGTVSAGKTELPGVKMGTSAAGKSVMPGVKMGASKAGDSSPPGVKLPQNFASMQQAVKTPGQQTNFKPTVQVPTKKLKPEPLTAVTGTKFDDAIKQRRAASMVKEQEAKFKSPPIMDSKTVNTQSSLYRQTVSNPRPVKQVIEVRETYYRDYRAPRYVYDGPSSSGMWDGFWLGMVIGNATSSSHHADWSYHHWDDPGYVAYRQQMREQARSNAELAQRLDALEAKNKEMAAKGLSRDVNYMPPDVPREAIMATTLTADVGEVEVQDVPTLNCGTGGLTGNYYKFGNYLAKYAQEFGLGFNVNVRSTAGGAENLEGFGTKFDIIIAQSDTIDMFLRTRGIKSLAIIQMELYPEYMHLLVNLESDVDEAEDLDPKTHVIYPGPKGSGSDKAWRKMAADANSGFWGDSRYAKMNVMNTSYEDALEAVAHNKNAVLFYVVGLNSEFMRTADEKYAGKMKMVAFNDGDFLGAEDLEGNAIYLEHRIPGGTYPHLQKGWVFTYVNSLTVQAVLAVHPSVLKKYPHIEENLNAAIFLATQQIRKDVGFDE